MYATNYFETLILGSFRQQSTSAPATLYLALYFNDPGETGQAGTEVSYSGYARRPVTFSAPADMNGGTGVQNAADITFATTPVGIGTVTHVGVLDSLTGGNMLLYGEFSEPIAIEANEAPVVVAGEAQWWITGNMTKVFRARVLNFLRGQALSGFASYIALYNGDPESGGAELVGDNYARAAVTFSAPEEQTGGQMRMVNSATAQTNRSSTNWGTWAYTVVMDAANAGQPTYAISRTPKEIRKGMRVVYQAGTLTLTVN